MFSRLKENFIEVRKKGTSMHKGQVTWVHLEMTHNFLYVCISQVNFIFIHCKHAAYSDLDYHFKRMAPNKQSVWVHKVMSVLENL
jgi:hypothetical protein